MKRILAPHKEQDGWAYIRVSRNRSVFIDYSDRACGMRTISSRRVEEAVETADYLKRCRDEGLTAIRRRHGWIIGEEDIIWGEDDKYVMRLGSWNRGYTLREAYHRHENQKG